MTTLTTSPRASSMRISAGSCPTVPPPRWKE
jgi:hypothetical protein